MRGLIVAVLCLGSVAMSTAAEARGCIKGAILGGIAGHFAGHHALLGAAAGCAVGSHVANRPVRPRVVAPVAPRAVTY